MTLDVSHEAARQRFVTPVAPGREAVLEYRVAAHGVLDYHHTFPKYADLVEPRRQGRPAAARRKPVWITQWKTLVNQALKVRSHSRLTLRSQVDGPLFLFESTG
jgi:hypothetical protein